MKVLALIIMSVAFVSCSGDEGTGEVKAPADDNTAPESQQDTVAEHDKCKDCTYKIVKLAKRVKESATGELKGYIKEENYIKTAGKTSEAWDKRQSICVAISYCKDQTNPNRPLQNSGGLYFLNADDQHNCTKEKENAEAESLNIFARSPEKEGGIWTGISGALATEFKYEQKQDSEEWSLRLTKATEGKIYYGRHTEAVADSDDDARGVFGVTCEAETVTEEPVTEVVPDAGTEEE